jgi:hypothetical protein
MDISDRNSEREKRLIGLNKLYDTHFDTVRLLWEGRDTVSKDELQADYSKTMEITLSLEPIKNDLIIKKSKWIYKIADIMTAHYFNTRHLIKSSNNNK